MWIYCGYRMKNTVGMSAVTGGNEVNMARRILAWVLLAGFVLLLVDL